MNLSQVVDALSSHGAHRFFFKWLAANDNSKNQIYLAGGFAALNELPAGRIQAVPSGKGGRHVFRASMRLSWLTTTGGLSPAPETKLILYPQYPEVRLSGFLRGSPGAPAEVLAGRHDGRVLVLGITPAGEVLGYAGSADSEVAHALPSPEHDRKGVLRPIPGTLLPSGSDSRSELLAEFARIHGLGWIDSKRLDSDGNLLPCAAQNCGGFTLEAELGVRPNSLAKPDFKGWEIKQVGVKSFDSPSGTPTLMTPEPDGGYYREAGVLAFVRRFGYPDRRGRGNRLNFGGLHRVGIQASTGLTLTLGGYDERTGKIVDARSGIQLITRENDVAAMWSYAKLMEHWKQKHDRAAYALSMMRVVPRRQYRYAPTLRLGLGTDFLLLLKAFSRGAAYYDPGIKVTEADSATPAQKRRSQFRMKLADISSLYTRFETVSVA